MGYRFLACVFLCNFPNCVVTTSSLPLRLVYVSENNNNNNNNLGCYIIFDALQAAI